MKKRKRKKEEEETELQFKQYENLIFFEYIYKGSQE